MCQRKEKESQKILEFGDIGPKDETYQKEMKSLAFYAKNKTKQKPT